LSFGKDKQKSESKSKQTTTPGRPPHFYSPQGNLTWSNANKSFNYQPKESAVNTDTRNTQEQKLNELVGNVPTSFTAEDYFANPFYGSLSQLYRGQLDTQRGQDQKMLNDNLTARNQLGSSYDAYSNYLMNQDYGRRYDAADQQARLGAADAYTQAINNGLNSMAGLRADYMQGLDAYYAPLKFALSAQGAYAPFNPVTTTGTSSQSSTSTPSLLSRGAQYLQSLPDISLFGAPKK